MSEEELLKRKSQNNAIARGLLERMARRVPVADPVAKVSENLLDTNTKSGECRV